MRAPGPAAEPAPRGDHSAEVGQLPSSKSPRSLIPIQRNQTLKCRAEYSQQSSNFRFEIDAFLLAVPTAQERFLITVFFLFFLFSNFPIESLPEPSVTSHACWLADSTNRAIVITRLNGPNSIESFISFN